MRTDYHRWYSHRLGRDLGIAVYGHWGPPLITFPTSGGDEWEMQNQGIIASIADYIEAGKVKVFACDTNSRDSLYNRGAHPMHRSWMLRMFDEYLREEVAPFVWAHCQSPGIGIGVAGMSLGAYYAVNALLKHPDVFKRCYAMSGLYDMRRFMDGMYDDNFYFNNPVDYVPNLSDGWYWEQYRSCELRLITGDGPFEDKGASLHLAHLLGTKHIPHWLDDWGPGGGHDWPYWKRQVREYLGRW
jgi:esterase/lipase superfamily enzyme